MKTFGLMFTFVFLLLTGSVVFAQQMDTATPTQPITYPIEPWNYSGLTVKDIAQVATATVKGMPLDPTRIDVSISEQKLRVIEGFKIRYEFLVSTGNPAIGKDAIETPRNVFRISNVALKARKESKNKKGGKRHGPWLINWMRITAPSGGVGIHALDPKQVRRYEKKLGKKASHGCIRLSRKDVKVVYAWVLQYFADNGEYPQVYIY